MHAYQATIDWQSDGAAFTKGRYSRAHTWSFDGGAVWPASASPSVVPLPFSDETAVDPEEAMVAAISSCHMLWFLDYARRAGFTVTRYRDSAVGQMTTEADGRMWLSHVDLRPEVTWDGAAPDPATLRNLHHQAHESCFIANSVKTEIDVHLT